MAFPTAMNEHIGMRKEEIDTPALLIDLDIMEKNIETVARYYRNKEGSSLRPHQKGHRLPAIAKKQLEAGAVGVAMTSLGLADLYVNSGITDILVTSEIYGRNKILRLRSLAKRSDIIAGVDNLENVKQLSGAALANETKINVAVELYMGMGSCGVKMDKAPSFIKELMKQKGISFKGIWWHQGSLGDVLNWEDRKREHFKMLEKVASLKEEIEKDGIEVEMLSSGHTCTWNITPEYPHLRNVQVQAGNYVFSDWVDRRLEGVEVFDCALTVLTTCISRPAPDEAIFDSGMNTCSDEAGGAVGGGYLTVVGPKLNGVDGVKMIRQREEIMLAKFEDSRTDIRVGETYELIPPHGDTTAKLHDKYFGIRKGKVEVVWPNLGRGLF